MRIALAIVAIFCARFLMGAWYYAGHDGDLAWQQWLGAYILQHHHLPHRLGHETFTAPGAAWVPQEWAFSVAVAWFTQHGRFAILATLSVLAAAISLVIVAYRAHRRGASTFGIALATACTGFAMLQAFGVRAQIFGWLFFSIVLLVLDLENDWMLLGVVAVALWANVHASALIAPVIVGAWALGTWIEDRAWTVRVERNMVFAVGSLVAVCFTPLLWHLPLYAVNLETSVIRSAIAEWQPTDLLFPGFAWGLLPLLAICCYFGIAAPRERWRDGMLFAVAALITGIAVRHIPLAAMIVAPMAAQRISSVVPSHARVNAVLQEHFSEALIYVCSALVCGIIVLDLAHVPQISGVTLPKNAIVTLANVPGTHNLYCEDFAWCSLALEQDNLRTFIDGRCDPFPTRVWSDYLAVERVSPKWDRVLKRWNVDSVLVDKNNSLAQALALRRDWHLFYRDRRYEIFLRQDIATAQR
ncbi:MAG TPA: hypothetical protein VFH72_06010 [Candidatus Baltobacteraceae bacterium]|jgi:hypothetical protein|nr:hypothetical protein [Candidatus Baltobacteraceae bacterium]